MRYIPQSQYTFDEICEQCRSAINRSASTNTQDVYSEVRKFYRYDEIPAGQVSHMKDYGSLVK